MNDVLKQVDIDLEAMNDHANERGELKCSHIHAKENIIFTN